MVRRRVVWEPITCNIDTESERDTETEREKKIHTHMYSMHICKYAFTNLFI